jgi:hypothetical protein
MFTASSAFMPRGVREAVMVEFSDGAGWLKQHGKHFPQRLKCLPPHETGCHVVEAQSFAPTLRMVVKTIKRNHQPKI